jgi:hypothetical protein
LNPFLYVGANPMEGIDPLGLFEVGDSCCPSNSPVNNVLMAWQVQSLCADLSWVGDPAIRRCLEKRCKDGKIECGGLPCMAAHLLGATLFPGWERARGIAPLGIGETGWICPTSGRMGLNEEGSGFDNGRVMPDTPLGLIVIEEWAHTCGWGEQQDHDLGDLGDAP